MINGCQWSIDAWNKTIQKETMKAKKAIRYLNGKSSIELRALDIRDKEEVIMEISKIN